MSVPNQKVITIHKNDPTPPFLQISEIDWREAFQNLTRTAFGVYLYLAQNKNGYQFEYSPQAIANTGMMSKGQASKVIAELIEKGYVVNGEFYVQSPARRTLRADIQKEIIKIRGQS